MNLGDEKNQVHMEGYQVSNQCMALVRDGCLVPTKDAPELGYVRESTDKQYVPDVYYKVRNNHDFLYYQLDLRGVGFCGQRNKTYL